MTPAPYTDQAPVPPPSSHQTMATALHLDALTLVTRLHLLELCRVAVQVAQRQCPPPLGSRTDRYCSGQLRRTGFLLWREGPLASPFESAPLVRRVP